MEEQPLLISTLSPSPAQKRLALAVVMAMSVVYVASVPLLFVHQFAPLDVFVPLLDAALFLLDLITAVLLYAHFSVLGSRSLLVLASGYLLTAFLIASHALTFPGAFSPDGLLGAGIQTSNYLQIFWRMGLPCTAIAYSLLKTHESQTQLAGGQPRNRIVASVVIVLVVVCALVSLTTTGASLLPDIMVNDERRIWAVDAPFVIPLEIAAIVITWRRRQSVLDLWLLVVLWAWLIASLLVSTTAYRFSLVWYESRFFGLFASSFVLLGLLTQMTTLYTRLAVSLATQRHERESRLLQVDATLAVVSHEVNQPLAAIAMNGSAGLHEIAKAAPNISAVTDILTDILRDSRRASEIIASIRAMFKGSDKETQNLDVVRLVEDTVSLVHGDMYDRNISMETNYSTSSMAVHGDKTQLQQLLINLLTNAMEAAILNGKHRRLVRITVERGAEDVVIKVEDTGSGIDPELVDAIFDPFVTSKRSGRGLGLPICRTIVEAQGGRIRAGNSPLGGAIFTVSIPRLTEENR